MKLHRLTILMVLQGCCNLALAQISAGSTGLYVDANTLLSLDSMILQPTGNLEISNNQLQRRYIPVPGNPNGSVSKVYEWSSPILYSGTIGMYVAPGELNGNSLPLLQLSFSPQTGHHGFVTTTQGSVNPAEGLVKNLFNTTVFRQLTAVNAGVALPVHWLSFSAVPVDRSVVLSWKVSHEVNVREYVVQKSPDGINFEDIAALPARCNGCGGLETTYRHIDELPLPGASYYRIKEVDIDGAVSWSLIRQVVFDNTINLVMIGPNPASREIRISSLDSRKDYTFTIVSMQGALIKRERVQGKSVHHLNLSGWANGEYLLIIQNGQDRLIRKITVLR